MPRGGCGDGGELNKKKKGWGKVKADNEFLIALANKLLAIAEETTDIVTENDLRDLAEVTLNSCQ